MTENNEPIRVQSSTNGRGVIGFDGKAGQIVNAVVTATGLAVVEALGDIDFSSAPRVIATLAPVVVGLLTGWITNKMLPRFRR